MSGGSTEEVEAILAEGLGLLPGAETEKSGSCFHCRILLLAVSEPPLNAFMKPQVGTSTLAVILQLCKDFLQGEDTLYLELFDRMLKETGIICIGLFCCQHDPENSIIEENRWHRRFVLTSPNKQKVIKRHDKVSFIILYGIHNINILIIVGFLLEIHDI